ncbi:MAG: peptidase M17 [Candidatus Eisenbacteria bacterium]
MSVTKRDPGSRAGTGGRKPRGRATRGRTSRLAVAAGTAMGEVMRVRRGERVVIITNPLDDVLTISAALYDAALDRGADAVILVQPVRTSLEMASDAVIHALRSHPDVICSISAAKLGKDRFGLEKAYRFPPHPGKWPHIFDALMGAKKARAFWSPSVTLDMFSRTVAVDYRRIAAQARKLKRVLDAADRVHVTAPGGTDIEIGLRGRKAHLDDGSFGKPGTGGNLPAGEAYISPALCDAQGVMVFDGSLSAADGGAFVPRRPVTVEVRDGFVTAVRGGAGARRLEQSFALGEQAARKMSGRPGWSAKRVASYTRNVRHLGELGIGLNPAARVTGNMLEDEKILGTCHVAIGSNYDEDAEAFTHLDCLIQSPTIATLGRAGARRIIMKAGKII